MAGAVSASHPPLNSTIIRAKLAVPLTAFCFGPTTWNLGSRGIFNPEGFPPDEAGCDLDFVAMRTQSLGTPSSPRPTWDPRDQTESRSHTEEGSPLSARLRSKTRETNSLPDVWLAFPKPDNGPGQATTEDCPGQATTDDRPGQAITDKQPGQATTEYGCGQATTDAPPGQAITEAGRGVLEDPGPQGFVEGVEAQLQDMMEGDGACDDAEGWATEEEEDAGLRADGGCAAAAPGGTPACETNAESRETVAGAPSHQQEFLYKSCFLVCKLALFRRRTGNPASGRAL